MRSSWSSDVQNKPEKRAIEVGLQRVVMTSHSDVHVQVNVYLNLPTVMFAFMSFGSCLTPWICIVICTFALSTVFLSLLSCTVCCKNYVCVVKVMSRHVFFLWIDSNQHYLVFNRLVPSTVNTTPPESSWLWNFLGHFQITVLLAIWYESS